MISSETLFDPIGSTRSSTPLSDDSGTTMFRLATRIRLGQPPRASTPDGSPRDGAYNRDRDDEGNDTPARRMFAPSMPSSTTTRPGENDRERRWALHPPRRRPRFQRHWRSRRPPRRRPQPIQKRPHQTTTTEDERGRGPRDVTGGRWPTRPSDPVWRTPRPALTCNGFDAREPDYYRTGAPSPPPPSTTPGQRTGRRHDRGDPARSPRGAGSADWRSGPGRARPDFTTASIRRPANTVERQRHLHRGSTQPSCRRTSP